MKTLTERIIERLSEGKEVTRLAPRHPKTITRCGELFNRHSLISKEKRYNEKKGTYYAVYYIKPKNLSQFKKAVGR